MFSLRGTVSAARVGSASESSEKNSGRVSPSGKLAWLAVAGFAFLAVLGSTSSLRAEPAKSLSDVAAAVRGSTPPADTGYSALLDFVQLIGGETPKTVSAKAPVDANHQFINSDYAALRDFAVSVGALAPQPATTAAAQPPKTDDAYSTLNEFAAKLAPESSKPIRVAARAAEGEPATYVGSQTCLKCHSSQATTFGMTLMGKLGKTQKGKFECENCHGPGSVHARKGGGRGVGGITSFRPEDTSRTAEENNAICLTCHERGNRTMWRGSTHDQRDVACTNCHTIMKSVSRKSQLKTEFQPDTCFQCHKNKRAEMWRSSHIPVREGKVVCTNCHNPHGTANESLLKTATVNETCYQCHAEKRGPFLFEHPPVRESCLNCHDPHGSNNDFLLKISRPRLCQQCHAGGIHNSNPRNPFNTLYAQGRECQNCHSNHHGSNSPAGARWQR